MGYGPVRGGKQLPITPRNGKNWCDLANTPVEASIQRLALERFPTTNPRALRLRLGVGRLQGAAGGLQAEAG